MAEKWFHIEPVSESDMNLVGSRYTPCEIMREIFREINDPEIKLKCRIACAMTKSMAARITKYEGRRWGKEQYPFNPNRKE